jgi:hypothetical protein
VLNPATIRNQKTKNEAELSCFLEAGLRGPGLFPKINTIMESRELHEGDKPGFFSKKISGCSAKAETPSET